MPSLVPLIPTTRHGTRINGQALSEGNNYESYVSLEDAEQAWQRHLVTLASATVVAALAPPIELFAAADPVEKRIRIEIPDSEDDPGMLWNPLKVAVC